jgi:hypothetical protein
MSFSPAALELHSVLTHGGPGVPDTQRSGPVSSVADRILHIGEQASRSDQHPVSGCGERHLSAVSSQQPHSEFLLQSGDSTRYRWLRHTKFCRGSGEATMVDDRDQTTQTPQVRTHTNSVSTVQLMHFVNR